MLGGPITVTISQDASGVFVGLPARRELNEAVFGTPEHPRELRGSPVITGVPLMMRGRDDGEFTTTKAMTPFGDKHIVLPEGELQLRMVDATATDTAVSDDGVRLSATWQDQEGNAYTVRCCAMLATKGIDAPTFGVVTNHLLHGVSATGTGLMPTAFAYAAFWGMGSVSKNGEVLARPRLIHGMLTEYVRTEGYGLATDVEVTPTRRHFHLMVPPMMPVPEEGRFEKSPVRTGFQLPNGMQLPFWHVMFENLDIEADREG